MEMPLTGTGEPKLQGSALMYENAVYLTLVDTWEGGAPSVRDMPLSGVATQSFRAIRVDDKLPNSGSRLVLDVPQGSMVGLPACYLLGITLTRCL